MRFLPIFPNEWIELRFMFLVRTFCTDDRCPEHCSAVSVVTCANVRPMWTMWPSSGVWDHCQCARHISAGEEWHGLHFNYMQLYLAVKATPINYTFVSLLVSYLRKGYEKVWCIQTFLSTSMVCGNISTYLIWFLSSVCFGRGAKHINIIIFRLRSILGRGRKTKTQEQSFTNSNGYLLSRILVSA